jgi:hypothetical protein
VRYFLQWAGARGLTGDLAVPLPPRTEPARLLGGADHIQQLDRCLADDVIDDGQTAYLADDRHRLLLPPQLASLARQLRGQDESRWTLARLGAQAPWLFPGRSPDRPAVDVLFGTRLQRSATALERERPVVLLISDPDDLGRLVEEPGRRKAQRIAVIHV